jgi:uncharacterized membrane protein YedE/YeeE
VKRALVAFTSGLIFAIGLAISGMTQPGKVTGFLDVTGDWDPSLALVMGGGVAVLALAWLWVRRHERPVLAEDFPNPPNKTIDVRLVGGAALFGVGWGLAGLCPGPAIVSLAARTDGALWFVPGMVAGIALMRYVDLRAERPAEQETGAPGLPSISRAA